MIRILNQYASPKTILLMVLEGGLIAASIILSIRLRFWNDPALFRHYVHAPLFIWQAAVIVACFQICFYYNDLYDLSIKVRARGSLFALPRRSAPPVCSWGWCIL